MVRTRRTALRILGGKEQVLVTPTVLLELEWVLRAAYGLSSAIINRSILQVLGLPQLVVKEAEAVGQALRRHAAGMDFADALHLALAGDARPFFSFDRKLVAKARNGNADVELLT